MTNLDDTTRQTQFEAAAPDVVAEDFGDEIVVLNLANGRYFSLPGISATIWRDLAEGVPPMALMAQAGPVGAAMVEAVEAVAAKLLTEGLLRARTAPAAAVTPKADFATASGLPTMESYDDMADLILADPIHDVDENIGWPVKRDDLQSG